MLYYGVTPDLGQNSVVIIWYKCILKWLNGLPSRWSSIEYFTFTLFALLIKFKVIQVLKINIVTQFRWSNMIYFTSVSDVAVMPQYTVYKLILWTSALLF